MKNPTNDRTLDIRQADSGDTAAVLELYRQLVRPVAPDYRADCSKIMLQSHGKRVEAHAFFEAQGFSTSNKKGFVKYRSQMGAR